jgi:predicted dienelactone hydrolase
VLENVPAPIAVAGDLAYGSSVGGWWNAFCDGGAVSGASRGIDSSSVGLSTIALGNCLGVPISDCPSGEVSDRKFEYRWPTPRTADVLSVASGLSCRFWPRTSWNWCTAGVPAASAPVGAYVCIKSWLPNLIVGFRWLPGFDLMVCIEPLSEGGDRKMSGRGGIGLSYS